MLVDLAEKKPVQSSGEDNKYMAVIRNDYSRFTKVYFLRSKDDTAEYSMKYIVDIAPRKVNVARNDEGGRLRASLVPSVLEKRIRKGLRLPIPLN